MSACFTGGIMIVVAGYYNVEDEFENSCFATNTWAKTFVDLSKISTKGTASFGDRTELSCLHFHAGFKAIEDTEGIGSDTELDFELILAINLSSKAKTVSLCNMATSNNSVDYFCLSSIVKLIYFFIHFI